jgi:pilus assembly protein CpaC
LISDLSTEFIRHWKTRSFMERALNMRVGRKYAALAALLVVSSIALGQAQANTPNPAPDQSNTPPNTGSQGAPTPSNATPVVTPPPQNSNANPQAPVPPSTSSSPQAEPAAAAPLRVLVGKSLLINTTERLKRVAVTDPGVADAQPITPTQILVHGRAPGEVSLLIWDELERSRSFDLRVDVDVSAATEEIHRVFPDEQITVSPSRNAIVLSGHVSTEDVAKRAALIADAYSKSVVNVLSFGPVGAQEILLEVKFADVDRAATIQLGANFFSTGAGNTIGTTTTGQFGGFSVNNSSSGQGSGGSNAPGSGATVNFNNALNIFLFRRDINFGAIIADLQQKNLLQILAEPNLIAVNGKEASFLAGGEFPFPVVQAGQGVSSVTIQFREFGVKLKFTPVIMPSGAIHLHVVPEVSALDFANGLTISGFNVPALTTRKADTEFEIQDGQSFVIAGLLDNRVTSVMNKMPGIGDIPVLGYLFRSKSASKSRSELMVMVTARRVSPLAQPPSGPSTPRPYMDKDKFDNKKPSGGSQ